MTTQDIIALYAPLAGVVGLAFWSGVLTQKVAGMKEAHEKNLAALKDEHAKRLEKLESHSDADMGMAVQLGVLVERVGSVTDNVKKIDREMQGVQRTLANMMQRTSTPVTEFKQD